MAEFAGYVGNQVPPIDWGKIGTDLYDKINKVNDERKAEKQKIDDDYNESFTKIGDYEQTTDQSLNEMIYKGVDEVRNSMKTQYDLLKKGAITMADYKLYKNTAMTDWSTLNKAVKGYGNTIAGVQKLITEGKMSGLGQYNALTYAKLSNLKDAKIMVNPETGRIYRANIDPKTGTIASGSDVYSPSAMLNPGNLVDLKVDLNDGVTKFLKTVADYGIAKDLGGGRIEVTEDARKNPAYQKALEAQVNSFTVTPRSTTSVLTDYIGDYQFFESEAQKKELINKGVKEDKLIKVERKNGVYEPVPTSTQEAVAKEYVRSQIEVGVGRKETRTQGYAPVRETVDKLSAYDKKEADIIAKLGIKAETANKIWAARQNSPQWPLLRSAASERGLDSPKVTFVRERDSSGKLLPPIIRITGNEMIVDSGGKRKKGGLVVRDLRSAEDVYTYINTKQDPSTASAEYQQGNEYFEANRRQSSPAPEKTSSNVKIVTMDMIRQQVKNSGKPVTQENIDAYTNQLESTGKFKVQR